VVAVLFGFVGAKLAQHPDGGGRGVEDVDPEALGNPPGTAGIRVGGNAFVHDTGGRQRQGTVNDVGVARDPADVGEAPVGVLRLDVLVVLRGAGDIREVSAGAVLRSLRFGGGTARNHQEEGLLGPAG